MTQEAKRKPRLTGEEGAASTKWVVDEVKRRRAGLDWSAEQLAEKMTAAGVPWTRDVVVNLENGRRKTLALHELLALAWVLDVASPVDLLVPPGYAGAEAFPVTPNTTATPDQVRAWFTGKPLHRWVDSLAELKETVRQSFMIAESVMAARGVAPQGEPLEDVLARLQANIDRLPMPDHWSSPADPPPGGRADGQD